MADTALITIPVTRNVTAPLAKTIATVSEVIVGIGTETETGTEAGEKETTATATPTATGNAQTVVTAKGTVKGIATRTANAVVIAKKDVPATRTNADETTRAKMTDAAHTASATKREVPAVAAARKRKASGWDVHAPGYEQYSAMQAKQTGLFNLPGANRTQIPPILAVPGLPPPMPVPTFGMGMAVNPNLSRQSRRLYIGSITPDINEQNLADFFNNKMTEMKIGTGAPGNPVLAVQCNYEKSYAFVEFRSAEDATAAMAFDGIMFLNGPSKSADPKTTAVMELLKSFGDLKAFNLVRDNGSGPSKGFAFFEYVDPAVTDVAIVALSGMTLGDRQLVVQLPRDPAADHARRGCSDNDARVLLMLNMVTPDDLIDDEEYVEIVEDIRTRFQNMANGVGRVYVKFVDSVGAAAGMKALAGRSFAGRSIIATLLGEESQTSPPLEVIFAPQPDAPPPLPLEM
ncbi:hypothetical protein BC826DRAFT_1113301 [Russula brevipes]|nr:hypothetical protein BC826DRAFT_1113301 [Russula brevipes]